MSRITNNMIINDFMRNFNRSQNRLNDYMNQLSTGKKFDQISDSSLEAVKALRMKTDISFNSHYIDNAEDGISRLKTTDEALDDVVKTLRDIRDGVVRGSTDSLTPEDKAMIAKEIEEAKEHLIQVGNTRYEDLYIFNGTKALTKPYQTAATNNPADYENGTISTDDLKRKIGDVTDVAVNVSGDNIGFSQMFADLEDIINDLETDAPNISNQLDTIDDHIENVLGERAKVGARQQRLEMARDRMESQEINYNKILSDTEDIDVAETITKLKSEESVYRTALATGARIIQPTLMDFLR